MFDELIDKYLMPEPDLVGKWRIKPPFKETIESRAPGSAQVIRSGRDAEILGLPSKPLPKMPPLIAPVDEETANQIIGRPNMARGGLIGGNPELLDTLTAGTSQQMAPPVKPVVAPPIITPPAPAPAPLAKAPPVATPAPVSKPLPGMPPSVTPTELEGYLGRQKASLNRFGPDQQMALQDQISRERNSFGNKATGAIKGFADAIMMGVAGAGNPGYQAQHEAQFEKSAADRMGTLQKASEGQMKQTEAGMTLDQMNPNSVLSKSAQEAYGPLFQKLGYQPQAIKGLSAAKIDSALALMTQLGGAEIQAMIKQYELELEKEKNRAASDMASKKLASDEKIAREKIGVDVANKVLDQETPATLFNPLSWISKVPGEQEEAAQKVLMNQIEMTPDVQAYAEKHGISPEQALQIKKQRGG